MLLCPELPWKNITNPASGSWTPCPAVLPHHLHMYLWCPLNFCLITKCPHLCLLHLHPLSLSPSPTTPEENSGDPVFDSLLLHTMAQPNGLWNFFLYEI